MLAYGFPGTVVAAGGTGLVGCLKSNIEFVSTVQLVTMITRAAAMIKENSQRNAVGTRNSALEDRNAIIFIAVTSRVDSLDFRISHSRSNGVAEVRGVICPKPNRWRHCVQDLEFGSI